MSAAELRAAREMLGVSLDWLAAALHMNPRTVRDWAQGREPIPERSHSNIEDLLTTTRAQITREIEACRATTAPAAYLLTYRQDDDVPPELAWRGTRWPAAWHRIVCARAADAAPDLQLRILFAPPAWTAHFGNGVDEPQHRVLVEDEPYEGEPHGPVLADYTVAHEITDPATADAALAAGGWHRTGDYRTPGGGLFHAGPPGSTFHCTVDRPPTAAEE